ncbi:hypothetical protein [Caballeronia catudaia]
MTKQLNRVTFGCSVRNRPAEEDLRFDEFALPNGEDLRIAKCAAIFEAQVVGHEYAISIGNEMNEREFIRDMRIRPATREVRRSIESIVARTREVEIVGDKGFDRVAVLRDIGLIDAFSDGYRIEALGSGAHHVSPMLRRVVSNDSTFERVVNRLPAHRLMFPNVTLIFEAAFARASQSNYIAISA